MRIRPVQFEWTDDEVMKPLPRFQSLCARQFVIGEVYSLDPTEEVSQHDRGGLFAAVKSGWKTLAEEWDGKFPTTEHLRKWALIEVGYCTQDEYTLKNEEDAKVMTKALRRQDEFCRIAIHGDTVIVRNAKSIANNAIKSKEFKALKKQVLDLVGSMCNSTAADLDREGKADTKPRRQSIDYQPYDRKD